MIGKTEAKCWPPRLITLIAGIFSEGNNPGRRRKYVRMVEQFIVWLSEKSGVTWKMSSDGVHEGVKLQTTFCPEPCASKGISCFIDRVAGFHLDGVCGEWPRCSRNLPPTLIAFLSRSPPIYCSNFSNFSGLVVWRDVASPSLWKCLNKKPHIQICSQSCLVGNTHPVIANREAPPIQVHQMNNQINVLLH